jgi:hypothetical protein
MSLDFIAPVPREVEAQYWACLECAWESDLYESDLPSRECCPECEAEIEAREEWIWNSY